MKTREEILQEALDTGEVIKVRYFGGSNPGAERELVIRKMLPNGYVRCFCLRDNMEKTFFLNKIEIAGMSSEDFVNKESSDFLSNYQNTNQFSLPFESLDMPRVLCDFIRKNWQAWISSELHINVEVNSLSLHQKRKDGKPMKKFVIHLQYEDMRYYTTDYSGKKPIALFRKNEKPWMVQAAGETTISFVDFDKAEQHFMKLLNLKQNKPEINTIEPKEVKLDKVTEIKSTKLEVSTPIEKKWYKHKLNFKEIMLVILLFVFLIPIIIPCLILTLNFLIEGKIGEFIGVMIIATPLIFVSHKIIKKLRK